jgi:adenylate cyclase
MLNEYFGAITSAVFEQDGFVDKFVGDELMAVFGAPLEQPDHAARAAAAAIGIKRRLHTLNNVRERRSQAPLNCGIGLHSGPAAAGHIGSALRANYTVVGHTVNVAARIEELTANGEILMSKTVLDRLGGAFGAKPFCEVELRGSGLTHQLYELLADARVEESK